MTKRAAWCANQRTDGHEFMKKISYLPINSVRMLGVLVAAFAILTGCQEQKAPPQQKPHVSYMLAQSSNVPLVTELPGRVSAYTVSEVRPQITGVIQKRLFEEGADVAKDQQLYQIDPALFRAAHDRAVADLANARANMRSSQLLAERYSKIVDINAVSRQEYDNAVAAYEQASAAAESARQAVTTARINLEYTKVLSPISGRISRSFFTPGALVTQNQPQPLATVQQLSPVYVDVTQSSSEILKLRRALARGDIQAGANKGANVKLLLEDGTLYTGLSGGERGQEPSVIMGELQFSDVTVDQSAGVISVRATFENPDYVLLPGMYVRAVIEEGIREGAILIPQSALMRDQKNQPIVYVLSKELPGPQQVQQLQKAGQAAAAAAMAAAAAAAPKGLADNEYVVAMRAVTIDRDYKNHWIVTAGLKEGDRVMTAGFQSANPGQVVTGTLDQPETPAEPARASVLPDKVILPDVDDTASVAESAPVVPAAEEAAKSQVSGPAGKEGTDQKEPAPAPAPAKSPVVPATAPEVPAKPEKEAKPQQKEVKHQKKEPTDPPGASESGDSSTALPAVSDRPDRADNGQQKATLPVQEAPAVSSPPVSRNGTSAVRETSARQPYKEQATVKEKAE